MPRQKITMKPSSTAVVPHQAELLADHRINHVGMRFRQIQQLLLPLHQPESADPA